MADQATPRPSTSVILVRDAVDGLQTFMLRRHAASPVAPSAYVFPGGTVRTDDRQLPFEDGDQLARTLSERSDVPVESAQAAALYASAVRELFEEAGVLLVRDSTGALLTVDEADTALQEKLQTTRLALQARDLSLGGVLADWGWQPAFDLLIPFSHWVTPTALARRFDTRFFVAEMPPRQAALHDTIETSEGLWLQPAQVLDGDYQTVYATAQHLRRIDPFRTVADVLAFARTKRIMKIQPQVFEGSAGLNVYLEPDLVDTW